MFSLFKKKIPVLFTNPKTQAILEEWAKTQKWWTQEEAINQLHEGYARYLQRKTEQVNLGIVEDAEFRDYWAGLQLNLKYWNLKYQRIDEVTEKEFNYRFQLIFLMPNFNQAFYDNEKLLFSIPETEKDENGFRISPKYISFIKKYFKDNYSKELNLEIDEFKINPNYKRGSEVFSRPYYASLNLIKQQEQLFI